MTEPQEKELLDNVGKIAYTLDKAYISRLSEDYGVLAFEKYNTWYDSNDVSTHGDSAEQPDVIDYASNVRALKIERWMYDRAEQPGECLKNVLTAFADGDHTVAVVIHRTPTQTEMYFVVKNEGPGRNDDSASNLRLLDSAIKGNFQGTKTSWIEDAAEIEQLFSFDGKVRDDDLERDEVCSIALLANSPSQFSEQRLGQGIEKLLNGIVPETDGDAYTVIFLAESLNQNDVREILSGYEDMATAISPFQQYQFQKGLSEVETDGEMNSISKTESISDSIYKTHSINIGINGNRAHTHTDGKTVDFRGAAQGVLEAAGTAVGAVLGAVAGGPGGVAAGAAAGLNLAKRFGGALSSLAPQVSDTDSASNGIGLSAGYGYSWGKSKTITSGKSETTGKSHSLSLGNTKSATYTYKSYLVTDLLEKLERSIQKINQGQATGLWKYSTYILSGDSKTSQNVANYIRAITQGKESYVESAIVQEWSKQEGNGLLAFDEIKKYLAHFSHPVFVTANEDGNIAMMVTGTSYVATEELSHVIAFPKRSMQGLPILDGVQFGREPHTLIPVTADLHIGYGYHMRQTYEKQNIYLTREELKKHTFITGSTGSGKTNTICKLLYELSRGGCHFLVVEPAKGEYKNVLENLDGVKSYGTNPKLNGVEMLHINPFSFPPKTHILEHMDRLIEVFNVCWPMYAAMPAILKEAIERAYVSAGWDLVESENKYDNNLFPSFTDVMNQVKLVLASSDYSADNKGDYTGALVTRLRSLTNGLNGQIFTSCSIPDSELFDGNVIVDLSRVGSAETKSLIMGLLVIKLQEHRMEWAVETDTPLHHVTVLEEAHHLLKRTSSEQPVEGSNMRGKSVEMLANAIAEMRSYGEGFIVADQSPGLLDLSVIRNTNTKIIMRLPDFSDRDLVGKAAGLTDDQIVEIGRLERGVAAISQSDWLEPILCMVQDYKSIDINSLMIPKKKIAKDSCYRDSTKDVKEVLLNCIMTKEIYRKGDRVDARKLADAVVNSQLSTCVKCDFLEYISVEQEQSLSALRKLVYDFFDAKAAIEKSRSVTSIEDWAHDVVEQLNPAVKGYSHSQIDILISLITREQFIRDRTYSDIYLRYTEQYRAKGEIS